MKVERHVAHERRRAEPADGENGRPALFRRRSGSRVDRADVAPDHEADELGLIEARGRLRGCDSPPLAHDRDLFGDRKHFLEPVRDEDDRALRGLESRDHVEQTLDFARAQGGGRLVENDEIGFERERLGDLHELALGRGKVAGFRFQRQRMLLAEVGEDLAGAPPHGGPRQPPGPAEIGKENVLEHREVGGETCLLHHHGDAGVKRLARTAHVERLAAVHDLPRIAAHMARYDARQRRLSGPIRAEQRMRDARTQAETRIDKRARLREALRRSRALPEGCSLGPSSLRLGRRGPAF